eukprot:CAMPEP_0206493110 /NCGR_PEP_ID=MMETSP0324_2-20121206/46693_1 /ASSEMBLY_ACC=CAM_ASM_000836 /TAXON_ID=2866 /ORGANISM="Crypthecodinium cohnii, Strain Seligo" /LENGTH=53 /DNA_ID=CAMNT_0053976023 /DNA_START=129 /DNA_END=290 /DNA_ORIENTATION=+
MALCNLFSVNVISLSVHAKSWLVDLHGDDPASPVPGNIQANHFRNSVVAISLE